ncbi:hypothetical protein OTU49_002925, partial [Cherax quadricarinatus]
MEGPIVDLLKTKWETFVKNRFNNLFFIFLTYFLISMGAYVNRPVPCVSSAPTTLTKRPLSIMELPALNITCVNVSIHLHPEVIIEDPTITTDPTSLTDILTAPTTNLTRGLELMLDIATSTSSSNVTLEPEDEELEDDFLPLLLGTQTEVVTQLPADAVTVQYVVE